MSVGILRIVIVQVLESVDSPINYHPPSCPCPEDEWIFVWVLGKGGVYAAADTVAMAAMGVTDRQERDEWITGWGKEEVEFGNKLSISLNRNCTIRYTQNKYKTRETWKVWEKSLFCVCLLEDHFP